MMEEQRPARKCGLKVMFFNFTLVLFRFVSSVTGSVQVSVGTK